MPDNRSPRRRSVSATEAAKTFGRLVDRVREEHATYIVERGGVEVARISPAPKSPAVMRDLKTLLADVAGRLPDEYAVGVETATRRHNVPRKRRNPWAR